MKRSLKAIVLAIQLSAPWMKTEQATGYAEIVQEEAAKRGFDPFAMVALIEHESGWQSGAKNANGDTTGLGAVLPQYAKGIDLSDGAANLRFTAAAIESNKAMCKKVLKRTPKEAEWMACYGGFCTSKAKMCVAVEMTENIVSYKKCLGKAVKKNIKPGGKKFRCLKDMVERTKKARKK
jgi:hypothetical protein